MSIEIASRDGDHRALYEFMDHQIANYHPHLAEAHIILGFHFGWKADADGRIRLIQVTRPTPLVTAISRFEDVDFVILFNVDSFRTMTPTQRLALLDEGLCHCRGGLDRTGLESPYRVVKPDFLGFIENVRRYGAWRADLMLTRNAFGGEEVGLFSDIGNELPAPDEDEEDSEDDDNDGGFAGEVSHG
ncbi:putative metallopeptidase [Tuwongella immobilis]|uniref:Putative phage metallopeptidase domain-containing protein n=1 Tax=Tuwongella immobilis TaxID=692036 RepID=A0A6C2YQM8_9BACT|nr:putative metallopeptidase [Tuwongella immobilis]VIP03950.1 Uncharacterized protein OS=Thermosinus carboxydivorans Nor1 GN=TcarDRAFT_1305 PE=4 SV=1 [Tuwongella immobilis]VTS05267.1 Uncharacterized protein OS=Thermosinus carboxydivorans Nor1 GN=TcarDRAFT_1305 PE=4 SV=1 [Tuwongella immobilis]